MQVLQLTNVDKVLGLNKRAEEFEVSSGIGLRWTEVELFLLGSVIDMSAKDKSSKFIILKPVHEDLLVALMSLIVKD